MENNKNQVALAACSDLRPVKEREQIEKLKVCLKEMGLKVKESPCLYQDENGEYIGGQRKAEILQAFYKEPEVRAIFDVSGGNLANEVLPFLDFEVIRENPKPFFGYSDLTVLLNAIHQKTGQKGVLYQIRFLTGSNAEEQQKAFRETFQEGKRTLFEFPVEFLQGEELTGKVVGGNIRCLLKLAGTAYFPEMEGNVLFLESRSGDENQIVTFFYQLLEMGVFEKAAGLLLGTFTQLERESGRDGIRKVLKKLPLDENFPVAKTWSVGHGSDSRAVMIGENISLKAR